jgi:hypothetical protein
MDSAVYENSNHTENYYGVTEDPLRDFGMLEDALMLFSSINFLRAVKPKRTLPMAPRSTRCYGNTNLVACATPDTDSLRTLCAGRVIRMTPASFG